MRENPFLRDLTREQYELLSGLFAEVQLPARSVVFRQGDPAVFVYLILEGNVSVRYKPYDGPRITLTQLHNGDVFGWSSVLGNLAYTSDAVATTLVTLEQVRGESLRALCRQYPATGAQILEKLAAAVAPRWVDSRQKVQGILGRGLQARHV